MSLHPNKSNPQRAWRGNQENIILPKHIPREMSNYLRNSQRGERVRGPNLLWLGGGLKDENIILSTHMISFAGHDNNLPTEPATSSINPIPSSSGTSVFPASTLK
jgi:hypothetical protein